jgi:tetratricopeptide (TPR) repeat protein
MHLENALMVHRRNAGDDRSNTAWCLRQLVQDLAALGRVDDARPYGEELLELRRIRAEREDADAHALNSYAWELLTVRPDDLRNPGHALEMAQIGERRSPESYHYNRYTISLAYEALGQLEEAIAYSRRALENTPLEHSSERGDYESALVRMLEAAGNPQAAEHVYADTLAARRERCSSEHPDVAAALFQLGRLLRKHGKDSEAQAALRDVWKYAKSFCSVRRAAATEPRWSATFPRPAPCSANVTPRRTIQRDDAAWNGLRKPLNPMRPRRAASENTGGMPMSHACLFFSAVAKSA